MSRDSDIRRISNLPVAAILLLLVSCTGAIRTDEQAIRPLPVAIVDIIEDEISKGHLPGAVVHIEASGEVYRGAVGERSLEPAVASMTEDTIFDMASLTKVVATTSAVMKLIERGDLALEDRVVDLIPEFAGEWKNDVTIRHLMTHSSGLDPGLDLRDDWRGAEEGLIRAATRRPRTKPGFIFRYSDVNFILLGVIVERVSGRSLEDFVREEIFEPAGMVDTDFEVARGNLHRVAPTERVGGEILHGVVHDPTSRRMGGVAGHAGLFSTVADLTRFARMLLNGGTIEGVRVFEPSTVRLMTSIATPEAMSVRRGLGWDLDSIYSRPRGWFPMGSYGHTGWTGTFIWIDPASETFYIALSNRVHPDGSGTATILQERLGKAISPMAGYTSWDPSIEILPWRGPYAVSNGVDVLQDRRFEPLAGKRVGLITNHTGRDKYGNLTRDVLRSGPLELVSIFSPEHGLHGTLDGKVADGHDEASGLPVFSLYGERRKPAAASLDGLDVLVFDIQDLGSRYYTYVSTMGLAMEAAAESGLPFVVLDRINPIGGVAVQGPVEVDRERFVAFHPVAVRHGMTVGELARMFRDERGIEVDLTVVPLSGWKRGMYQNDTTLPWFDTSPNIRSLEEAILYSGIGLLEMLDLSVGRGTATPFELIGAPYIDAKAFASELNDRIPPGCITIEPVEFMPDASKFAGQLVGGAAFDLVDPQCDLPAIGIRIATVLHRMYPGEFRSDRFNILLQDQDTVELVEASADPDAIVQRWQPELREFMERRRRHLLY